MPNAQLVCRICGYKAKRALMNQVACRGFNETACEPASCPQGHGLLERVDNYVQEFTTYGLQVVDYRPDRGTIEERDRHNQRRWDRLRRQLGAKLLK